MYVAVEKEDGAGPNKAKITDTLVSQKGLRITRFGRYWYPLVRCDPGEGDVLSLYVRAYLGSASQE